MQLISSTQAVPKDCILYLLATVRKGRPPKLNASYSQCGTGTTSDPAPRAGIKEKGSQVTGREVPGQQWGEGIPGF